MQLTLLQLTCALKSFFLWHRHQSLFVSAAATAAAEQKIRIKLKAYDAQLLQQSVGLISDAASSTGARVSGPVYLPTR
jgi:small subunit ribosomal protein S10